MTLQPSLTQDFFSSMRTKYPNAYKQWEEWLKSYQKEIDWERIFRYKEKPISRTDGRCFNSTFLTKSFTDLPHAMQEGIWLAFEREAKNDIGIPKHIALEKRIQMTLNGIEFLIKTKTKP